VHALHEGLALLSLPLVQNVVCEKPDILHLVFISYRDLGAARNQVYHVIVSEILVRLAHVETEVFDVAIVIFDVHQVFVDLGIDFFKVIKLVAFLGKSIQECLSECAF